MASACWWQRARPQAAQRAPLRPGKRVSNPPVRSLAAQALAQKVQRQAGLMFAAPRACACEFCSACTGTPLGLHLCPALLRCLFLALLRAQCAHGLVPLQRGVAQALSLLAVQLGIWHPACLASHSCLEERQAHPQANLPHAQSVASSSWGRWQRRGQPPCLTEPPGRSAVVQQSLLGLPHACC